MKKKRKMKNTKKIIVIMSVFILFLISAILQGIIGDNMESSKTISKNVNKEPSGAWREALSSNDRQLIYLGTPSCSWCNKFRPGLDNLKDKYSVEFVYANVSEITQEDLNYIFDQLNINANEFGTPYIAIIDNGKKIAEQIGYVPEEQLFKFYQDNNLIDKSEKYN